MSLRNINDNYHQHISSIRITCAIKQEDQHKKEMILQSLTFDTIMTDEESQYC